MTDGAFEEEYPTYDRITMLVPKGTPLLAGQVMQLFGEGYLLFHEVGRELNPLWLIPDDIDAGSNPAGSIKSPSGSRT